MLHMLREEEEFRFLELTHLVKKKARDFAKKRHEREQNFSLFSLARVCHRVLSRRRSRIIRSSIVVYYYSVVVSRKRGTLRSSFLSEKEGERGAKKKNWI